MFTKKDKIHYIYTLKASKDQEIRYVGSTYRLSRRYRDHLWKAKKSPTQHRDKWINKILEEKQSLVMDVIENCESAEKAEIREIYWIAWYKANGFSLTNHTLGGEGVHSPDVETRKKISESQKGKKKGPISKETREKMEPIWASRKGKKRDPKLVEALRQTNTGRKFTEEHKAKLSAAKIGKKLNNKSNPWRYIICEGFSFLFGSAEKVYKTTGIPRRTVERILRGNQSQILGKQLKYVFREELAAYPEHTKI